MTSHPDFPEIQRRLKTLGYYPGVIDDEWGPGMAAGVNSVLELVEKAKGIKPPPPTAWPKLPAAYRWLREVGPVPRHLATALSLIGTLEVAGTGDSPTIMAWRDFCNAHGPKVVGYSADSVPWCGLFMQYVMLASDREGIEGALWALNWGKFGEPGGQPELGDVLTFKRPGGGHVALYIGEDMEGYYHVLGGNQGDKVSIMRIDKTRMHSCRQPPYKVKPASVKAYVVAASGVVSRNEA